MYKKGINLGAFDYLTKAGCPNLSEFVLRSNMTLQKYSVLKEHAFEFSCDFSCIKKRDLELFQRRLRRPGKLSFFLVCLYRVLFLHTTEAFYINV